MTNYMNARKPLRLYEDIYDSMYFVDKSGFLKDLLLMVASRKELRELGMKRPNRYICVTRPRRFGKSVNAWMIASYFMKGVDTHELFDDLSIASHPLYESHINKHNVIFMDLSDGAATVNTYDEYIANITRNILSSLESLKEGVLANKSIPVSENIEMFSGLLETGFIFIIDEWDYPLSMPYMKDSEKERYVKFLSEILKGKSYVEMCYMTGIMPINTYDIGTPLNMFEEYVMGEDDMYACYFGFDENEVDMLYHIYQGVWKDRQAIDRKQLTEWYDGYYLDGKKQIYNPKAIVSALTRNKLTGYWYRSSRYDELYSFIEHDIDGSKDAVALLLSGEGYPTKIYQYAAASTKMTTIDQIFSAMVVYGFLTYNAIERKVYIPNLELMGKFKEMLANNHSLGYLHTLYISSEDVLKATKMLDPKPVEHAVKLAHDKEISLFKYNDEDAYASIINLVYIAARDTYEVTREAKGGTGYADLLFRPKRKDDDIIVIELKVDDTPQNAIDQIKSREYYKALLPSFGEKKEYTGRIILVGIAYGKNDSSKNHQVSFEVVNA